MASSRPMGFVYEKRGWLYVAFKGRSGKRVAVATEMRDTPQNRLAAAEVLRMREAALELAADAGVEPTGRLTLAAWITVWLKRHAEDDRIRDDRGRLVHHVAPHLGAMHLDELRSRHVRAWLAKLRKGELAARTVRHCYDALRRVLREAQVDDLLVGQPWVILPGDLPPKEDADPAWRESAIFTPAEVVTLITDERIPPDRRVVYAILGLAGLRFGEAAALTWADYDAAEGRLVVARSYSTARHVVKRTKSGAVRLVPVHPTLASHLGAWKLGGWARAFGRAPVAEDLIAPSRELRHRSVSHGLKKALRDLEAVGLRARRIHDLRRTVITAMRGAGVAADLVRWITHGRARDVLDAYTNTPWPALVEAMERTAATYPKPPKVGRKARA